MPPGSTRTLRLYLSALSEDMAGERALLLERVLPDLRQRGGARGIAIELSDPGAAPERWGLEERLRAIEACDIFLAFLGERYGEPLKALPYEVLPVYSWLDPSWSLLEIEVRAAALDALPLIQNQGLFFVRVPEGRSGFPAVSPEEAERMADLKEKVAGLKGKVRGGRRPVVDDYPAVWSEAEGKAASLEDLEEVLQRGLEWALENAVATTRSGADFQATGPEPEPTPHLPSEPPPELLELQLEEAAGSHSPLVSSRASAPAASPAAAPTPVKKSTSVWPWRIWLAAALLLLPFLLFRTCGSANRSNETPNPAKVRIGASSVRPMTDPWDMILSPHTWKPGRKLAPPTAGTPNEPEVVPHPPHPPLELSRSPG